jgi:hypothetical protein
MESRRHGQHLRRNPTHGGKERQEAAELRGLLRSKGFALPSLGKRRWQWLRGRHGYSRDEASFAWEKR